MVPSLEGRRGAAARVMARSVVAALPMAVAYYLARLLALARVIGWEALDHAITGKHAPIDGEVPANHEGSHRGILLSQDI